MLWNVYPEQLWGSPHRSGIAEQLVLHPCIWVVTRQPAPVSLRHPEVSSRCFIPSCAVRGMGSCYEHKWSPTALIKTCTGDNFWTCCQFCQLTTVHRHHSGPSAPISPLDKCMCCLGMVGMLEHPVALRLVQRQGLERGQKCTTSPFKFVRYGVSEEIFWTRTVSTRVCFCYDQGKKAWHPCGVNRWNDECTRLISSSCSTNLTKSSYCSPRGKCIARLSSCLNNSHQSIEKVPGKSWISSQR